MPFIKSIIRLVLVVLILTSCQNDKANNESDQVENNPGFVTQLDYAKNFKVAQQGEIIKVTVIEPFKGANNGIEYYFVPHGVTSPPSVPEGNIIKTPVERLVCTSTTYLPSFEMLNAADRIVGFPSTEYISSKRIKERVDQGFIKDLGRDSKMNIELLIELDPEVVLTYDVAGSSSNHDQITRSGIPVVIGAGYLEEEPLGRAEWIKLVGIMLDKEKEADSIFNQIKNDYNEVLQRVGEVDKKPTVFTSTVYKDIWYMPGGESWAGKYFNYAGADYLWKDNDDSGSIELSFEAVYDIASEANYWIGTNGYTSTSGLIEADERYKNFKALQNNKVYGFNKRLTTNGGNDYFESGIARPDIVLKDIVKILHPELIPDHELYFYEKLNE